MQKVKPNRSGKAVILGIIAVVVLLLVGRNFLLGHDPNIQVRPPEHFPAAIDRGIISVQGATLGRLLFNDPILSLGQKISCASCHQQTAAYADFNKVYSSGDNYQLTKRNSPALMNLLWKESFFADGRATKLSETVLNAIKDSLELHSDMALILSRLNQDEGYADKFKRYTHKAQIEEHDFVDALVQYLRTLNSWTSKYDAVMQQREQFTAAEQKGWLLFQANCQSCHIPPLFSSKATYAVNSAVGKDLGRSLISALAADDYAFVVPTVRNIEFSAPYFHNGVHADLKSVLSFHTKKENTAQLQRSLTDREQQELLTFLKTLSDRQFVASNSY